VKNEATAAGGRHSADATMAPRLDAALAVAETIRQNRLSRITTGVLHARLIGSPAPPDPTRQ
jgi:hypothetical protein